MLTGWRHCAWHVTLSAMAGENSANSSDEIAVFQAYVSLINAERAAMWARHSALLVANSLILSALAISPKNKWTDAALLAAGLLISGAWLVITREGWAAVRRHVEIAGSFAASCFQRLPNPFSGDVYGEAQTTIYRLVLLVIALFVVMYIGLGYVRLIA
jgi:hypothetical protein